MLGLCLAATIVITMAEYVESISRRMLAESTDDHALWLDAFVSMCGGVFRTAAYDDDYRTVAISAPEDYATNLLYDNLMDAAAGRLEVPTRLENDQVEDWFVAQALKKGLNIYKASMELRDSLK
jgi:hypothetical protein